MAIIRGSESAGSAYLGDRGNVSALREHCIVTHRCLFLMKRPAPLIRLLKKAVMESVQALSHQKTIIMIAHRLSTVRPCDRIFMLDKGKLVEQGSYEELLKTSHKFKAMV